MAEGGGFEPPEACTSTVFKCARVLSIPVVTRVIPTISRATRRAEALTLPIGWDARWDESKVWTGTDSLRVFWSGQFFEADCEVVPGGKRVWVTGTQDPFAVGERALEA